MDRKMLIRVPSPCSRLQATKIVGYSYHQRRLVELRFRRGCLHLRMIVFRFIVSQKPLFHCLHECSYETDDIEELHAHLFVSGLWSLYRSLARLSGTLRGSMEELYRNRVQGERMWTNLQFSCESSSPSFEISNVSQMGPDLVCHVSIHIYHAEMQMIGLQSILQREQLHNVTQFVFGWLPSRNFWSFIGVGILQLRLFE